MKKLFLLLCILPLSLCSNATVSEVDGIYYQLIKKTNVAVAEVAAGTSKYTGNITIPETVVYDGVTYDVTAIQDNAFASCKELTSVSIPNSVTSIGENGFSECIGLTAVTIGGGVKEIGVRAFFKCTSLTEIVVPDNVTSIADYAFTGCTNLVSITLPTNLKVIGLNLFENCTSLAAITIPAGVTTIDDYAFQNCKSLVSLTIPESVTSIGNSAFAKSGLTSMTIPANVETFGNGLFHDCSSLVSATIPNTWPTIPTSTFAGCSSLTSFTIPASVTEIGGSAFDGCTSLTSMTIPGTVTTIGSAAFNACTGLTSVTFEKGVVIIGGMSFRDCSNLETVTLPESVTKIDDNAFLRCTSLKAIALPNSLTWLGNNTFQGCSGLSSLTIGTGLKDIYNMVFEDCSSLTSVVIPSNVTTLGFASFRNCSSLASLTLSEGLTEIGNNVFQNCSSLTTVTIPNSVKGIGNSAFMECVKLETVKLGKGIESISYLTFSVCENLSDVYLYAKKVPFAYDNTFKDSYPQYITLHVPAGSVDAYKAAEPWNKFKEIIALSDEDDNDDVDTEPISIGNSGKASYCGDKSLDFSSSDEVKAYIATGFDMDEGVIWLTRVKDVPAGVPVLIKGDANKTYDVPVTESQNSYYKNMFVGNTCGMTIQIEENVGFLVNYYLSSDGTFKSVNKTANIGNNKCYLQLPSAFEQAEVGPTQKVTIKDIGKASYAAPVDLDFTNVEGLKAFTATGYDKSTKTIWLTRVMKVQKGEGVLLKGDAKDYEIPSAAVQSSYMNMFVGNTCGVEIQVQETSADGTKTNFYLKGDGSFVSVNGYVNIGNNKCYLELPTSMVSTAAFTRGAEVNYILEEPEMIKMPISFRSIGNDDDGTTGIKVQSSMFNVQSDAYYTLQGQRVVNPSKGLYIRNGKIVVVR